MNLQLVSIQSTDNLQLPGLLFEPAHASKKAAIWLHGMGDNGSFYNTTRANALAKALTEKGISLLMFNNRGAHEKKRLAVLSDTVPEEDRYYQGGTHYEKIIDCINDIEGAVNFLKACGYSELFLIGHSTGANKICVYDANSQTHDIAKYVLAGPGDDSGLFYNELGGKRFNRALELAKEKIKANHPFYIMPKYSGMYPFSAQSAADILDPNGNYNNFPFYEATTKRLGSKPLFKEYRAIRIPSLVIIGELDEYAYTAGGARKALELFEKQTHPSVRANCGFELVPNSDHSFHGHEEKFSQKVASWLAN